jgi:hypothetical protein
MLFKADCQPGESRNDGVQDINASVDCFGVISDFASKIKVQAAYDKALFGS